jgi:DHA3 family tetracycline resistance protein-like MFS transporter
MLRPLRARDFRLLWTGMTASLLGDGVFLVALAWQVYELSSSPSALATVGLAASLPHVAFLLLGGVVSDRLERRRVMVAADVVRALAVGAMGVLSLSGAIELWQVVALSAVYGGATAFFGPAFDAIVPDLVPSDQLTEANSIDQFVRPAAFRLAGPALAGWLVAAGGAGSAFLFDAATFVVSGLCVLLLRPRPAAAEDDPGTLEQIREGFRYVRARVWLWGTFAVAAVAYLLFMGPIEVLLPFVVKHRLGGGPADLGFVFAMGGLGAIAGAVVMGHRRFPRKHITFMYLSWALATLAVAGYGLATRSWQAMAAGFAFNALETAGTIVWATTKHRLVPAALLGRVSSFDWLISIGLVPVSFAITGPVAGVLGAGPTLVWAGVLGAAITLGGLFLPGMRDIERAGALGEHGPEADAPAAQTAEHAVA